MAKPTIKNRCMVCGKMTKNIDICYHCQLKGKAVK